jgi:hypothetical protein
MTKDELLKTIQVKHRQLERYLFYFEKNSEGIFVAGDRPKFEIKEMKQPGVFGKWSLQDLISHIINWEQRFLQLYYAGVESGVTKALPSPTLRWDDFITKDPPVFEHLHIQSVQGELSEMKISYEQMISTVGSISDEVLFTPGHYAWTGDNSVADYVALFTYRHYDWVKRHIRRWRKSHAGKYMSKKIILDRIQTERRRLLQNLNHLSYEQMNRPEVIGEWSVKDIIAHLIDWEQRFIDWYQAGLRGVMPEIPAPGIGWDQLDYLNQRIYEKHRDRLLDDVLQEFIESYNQVLAVIENIPEKEIFKIGVYAWLGENNMVDIILANTANHYQWAKRHIRKWLKAQGKL